MMQTYQIDTSISDRGVINLPEMPYLHNKQVKLIIISPEDNTPTSEQRKPYQKTLGDFLGILPENEYVQLKKHTSQARKEWDRALKLIIISPEDNTPTLAQRRQAIERIMKRRETTSLKHYTDEELDDIRYEYLKEKHLRN